MTTLDLLNEHSDEIKQKLEKWNKNPNARMGANICRFSWLPTHFVKYGIERIENGNKLRRIIEAYNLDLLEVADEVSYKLPEYLDNEESNENSVVLSKIVDGKSGKGLKLSKEHVRQLVIATVKANHYDMHCANFVLLENNKLVIIDVDILAMPSEEKCFNLEKHFLLNGDSAGFGNNEGGIRTMPDIINNPLEKLRLMQMSKWPNYSDDAYNYLAKIGRKLDNFRKLHYESIKDINSSDEIKEAMINFKRDFDQLVDKEIKQNYKNEDIKKIGVQDKEKEANSQCGFL